VSEAPAALSGGRAEGGAGFFDRTREAATRRGCKNTLELILTAGRSSSPRTICRFFEVYVGGGGSCGEEYLAKHPHKTWVELESTFRDLAVGLTASARRRRAASRETAKEGPKCATTSARRTQESVHGGPSRQAPRWR